MSHYGITTKIRSSSDNDWLAVGAKVGDLVNEWAQRHDLIAYVGERAGEDAGAPAAYNPLSSEIEVNTKIAFGNATPEDVADIKNRTQQFEFPKATGAIFHEAMHARFSNWDLRQASEDLTPAQNRALHLLEESRIERLGVLVNPDNRVFLRSCALEIVLADMKESEVASLSSTRQAAQAMALTSARVDAGVLVDADIQMIRTLVDAVITPEKFDLFRAIWLEFQGLDSADISRMYDLAIAWDKLVEETADENGDAPEGESGESGQEGHEGSGSGSAFADALADALAESVEIAEIVVRDAVDDQKTTEEYRAVAEEAEEKRNEKRDHKELASETFGTGSVGPRDGTRSKLVETRKPTTEERVSAVKIAKALEKAKYQDRVRTTSGSIVPPGRLRSRTLVQSIALREKNIVEQAEPFKRVQRKHVDDPNLTIGVMVDISGSMGSAMEPMASAAWILSEAVRRVQGKVAMTYFGSDIFSTLNPGQHLTDVTVYSAPDGTEQFDKAFKATNGALELLSGSGARLLVVVSDGAYRESQTRAVKKWIARCANAGVGVLWIGAGRHGEYAQRAYCDNSGAVYTRMSSTATGVADEIGRAATEALNKASARR